MISMEFFDTRIVRGRRISIVVDNSKVEEISESIFQGVAVRALVDGAWGFVRSDSIEDLERSIERACGIARAIGGREILNLAESERGLSCRVPVKKDPSSVSLEEKVDLVREIERAARLPGISSTRVFYTDILTETEYSSSDGASLRSSVTRTGFGISAVAMRSGLLQSSSEIRAGVCGLELIEREDPFELARRAARTALDLLDARVPEGGRFPVVLDQELGGVFIHEAVGHAAEGDIVLEGGSILQGRVGEQIGSELVTVKDDPSLMHYGHYPFDDEGSAARETVLVENGILRSYLHTRETAGRLGGSPRNARAQGYNRPIVRMSNTYLANGDWSLEEIFEEMRDGVYLIGSRGGQVNTAEGIFQFNARRGYLVRKGEISELIRDVSLSGQTLSILKGVRAVADDLRFNSGGCGKGGQVVPVGDGAPHILIDEAVVGGAG